jgi:Leishmanolysin
MKRSSPHLFISLPLSRARCGHDPHYVTSLPAVEKVAQDYIHNPHAVPKQGRMLANTYVPINMNNSAPIRITAVYDMLLAGETGKQCTSVGQTITVVGAGTCSSTYTCKAENIVTGTVGAARMAVLMKRTNDALAYWMNTLRVKPVANPGIAISPTVGSYFTNPSALPSFVNNTDVVMIMTAHPSPCLPIAGQAMCLQTDQNNRCTVGSFNWVPEQLDVPNTNMLDTITNEMHTALHEIVHVLGGMGPGSIGSTPFLDPVSGLPNITGVYKIGWDTAYNKSWSLITSPKVLQVMRRDFNWSDADGFPLEDVELGRGVHWEARIAGPELMSYGAGSGRVFIADLTLAYLEDTGQYIANYSKSGSITAPYSDNVNDAVKVVDKNYVPPPPISPGALTWGRYQGASFIKSPATNWPAGYTCSVHQQYGCTPDHTMSATCVLAPYFSESSCASYGNYTSGSSSVCTVVNNGCRNGYCGFDPRFNYFQSDAAAVSAISSQLNSNGIANTHANNVGGFSNAMDYAPVMVGFWACADPIGSTNSSVWQGGEGGGLTAFESLFGIVSSINKIGGQIHGPDSKCFTSSLIELTSTQGVSFPTYGLCYQSNCYRKDYLQVGIKSFTSHKTSWYPCKTAGKLYIPGYLGAFHCPDPVQFCSTETITGYKYTETNLLYSLIFWGGLAILAVLFFILCAIPCISVRLIACFKSWCGSRQFEDEYKDDEYHTAQEAERAAKRKSSDGERHDPTRYHIYSKRILIILNSIILAGGLAMIGLISWAIAVGKLYEAAMSLLGISVLATFVGFVGLFAGLRQSSMGPTCWILTYFFINLVLLFLLGWTIVYNFAYNSWDSFVVQNFGAIIDVLPASYWTSPSCPTPYNIDMVPCPGDVALLEALFKQYIAAAAGLAAGIGLIMIVSLIVAARIIKIRTLSSLTIGVFSNVCIFIGFIFLGVGIYLAIVGQALPATAGILGFIFACGAAAAVLGSLGLAGIFKRHQKILLAFGIWAGLLMATFIAGAVYLSIQAGKEKLTAWIATLSDATISNFAAALGLSINQADLQVQLTTYLNYMVLASIAAAIICLFLVISAIIYSRALVAREKFELSRYLSIQRLGDQGDLPVAFVPGQNAPVDFEAGVGYGDDDDGGDAPISYSHSRPTVVSRTTPPVQIMPLDGSEFSGHNSMHASRPSSVSLHSRGSSVSMPPPATAPAARSAAPMYSIPM